MSLCTSELSGEPVFPRTRDMYSRTPVPTGFQQTSEKRRIILVSDMLPTSLVRTATSSLMPHLYPSTCSTSSASLSPTSPAPSSLVQTEVNSSGVATVRKCCFVTMRLQRDISAVPTLPGEVSQGPGQLPQSWTSPGGNHGHSTIPSFLHSV